MARPRKAVAADPFHDLNHKVVVLEREMTTQHKALERLKAMSARPRPPDEPQRQTRSGRLAR